MLDSPKFDVLVDHVMLEEGCFKKNPIDFEQIQNGFCGVYREYHANNDSSVEVLPRVLPTNGSYKSILFLFRTYRIYSYNFNSADYV